MRLVITIFIFLLYAHSLSAQEPQITDFDIQRFIEETFPLQNADASEDLYENLLLYYSHPLDINEATDEELRSLLILTNDEISGIINYREQTGRIISLYELQSISGLSLGTIRKLLPFVTITTTLDAKSLIERIIHEENNYLLLRYTRTLEDKKGYVQDSTGDANYAGSPDKLYSRFRVSHPGDFSIGFTTEKDAGEKLGADFYSGHIHVQNQGIVRDILLGDFQLQYGQGLVFGSGFNIGKSAETITTTRRSNTGLRPYTSALETSFFRGVGFTTDLSPTVSITGFYSRLKQDATVSEDSLENTFFSSVTESGFHRTETEIAKKDAITETNVGGNIMYSRPRLHLGVNVLYTQFDTPLLPALNLSNIHKYRGSKNMVMSMYLDYNWQNFSFFGELAQSKSGGVGGLFGMITAFGTKLESAIVIRNYQQNFHSSYSQAFGEAGTNINESGWYWGLKYHYNRKWMLTAYYDSFKFPWPSTNINAPTDGYETLARLTYKPNRESFYFFQIKQQSKADNPSREQEDLPIKVPRNGVRTQYILNADYPGSEKLTFKTRVQWSDYQFLETTTFGFAAWHDVNLDFGKFRISTRYAIFDTDNFDNAQFAYERDVLYAFSRPVYNGRGTRKYILFQYRPIKKLTFWLRLAQTKYDDRDEIGSGNERIQCNTKTDVNFQARIIF